MKLLIEIFVVIANLCLASWFILLMYEAPTHGLNRLFQYGLLCFFFVNFISSILNWLKKGWVFRKFLITISLGFMLISCISAVFGLREMIKDHMTWKQKQADINARLVGKSLQNLSTTTIDGEAWSFSNHVGKVILIDFWATWCGPCIQAMPEMKKIQKKYSDVVDFIMVGVSLDGERKELTDYCTSNSITWTQLFEPDMIWSNSIAQAFEVTGIPCACIVDRNCRIAAVDLNGREIYRKLYKILESQPGGGHVQ